MDPLNLSVLILIVFGFVLALVQAWGLSIGRVSPGWVAVALGFLVALLLVLPG